MREKNGFVVRILAVLLAFAMMLQPLPVFADGPEDTEQTAVETTAEEEIPEEPEAPEIGRASCRERV